MHIHSSVPFHLFPGSEFRSIRKDMKAPPPPQVGEPRPPSGERPQTPQSSILIS